MTLTRRQMIVGFTGTRLGMTTAQQIGVARLLLEFRPSEVRHGGCRGADRQFGYMLAQSRSRLESSARIIIHPGPANATLALQSPGAFVHDEMRPSRPFLDRNRDIVDASSVLIAAPDGAERLRSGTWSTVRYAKKLGRTICIVYQYGNVARFP